MSTLRSLTLFAPCVGPSLQRAIEGDASSRSALARLAGRGAVEPIALPSSHLHLPGWQQRLLRQIGLDPGTPELAGAPLSRYGEKGQIPQGYWLHAEPMHFLAGLDRLTAVPLTGVHRLALAERAEIGSALAGHLQGSGFQLQESKRGDWYVVSERSLDVRTSSPQIAAASGLHEAMPQGPDAPLLRRLMTELQMILHEHPANALRAARGAPVVNAVWLYGGGELARTLPQDERRALPRAFADQSYMRGLYLLHRAVLHDLPADAAALLGRIGSRADDTIAVVDTDDLDTLDALWLQPLGRAVTRGRIKRLDVELDHWRLQVTHAQMLCIWRGERPPSRWK